MCEPSACGKEETRLPDKRRWLNYHTILMKQELEWLEVLGRGMSGVCRKVRGKDGMIMVVKQIDISFVTPEEYESATRYARCYANDISALCAPLLWKFQGFFNAHCLSRTLSCGSSTVHPEEKMRSVLWCTPITYSSLSIWATLGWAHVRLPVGIPQQPLLVFLACAIRNF